LKKLTKINFNNFKAFFGSNYQIEMPNGENVLIYGENGSGKSSIYFALKEFFESSEHPSLPLSSNIYMLAGTEGSVEVTFSEFPIVPPIIPNEIFDFNTNTGKRTADSSNYIKKANKARAFLSYQELVRSYLADKNERGNPNLYDLIINGLLANHTLLGPVTTGYTVKERWSEIEIGININSARFKDFRIAKNSLPGFEQDLITILTPILVKLNEYLHLYFKNDVIVDIEELTIRANKFSSGRGWYLNKNFRLKIELYNDSVNNGYQNLLNEARLSAVAICLYLAAIKKSPQPDEFKIIFLDDVFIGLDTSNRLPLLELIKSEFPDHQIFISTYDRYWFETAVRWFTSQMPSSWKFYEIYVHKDEHIAGKIFDKPIITDYKDSLSKGLSALKNIIKPDYPSAANNFRKYAEEILTNKNLIPEQEHRNQFSTFLDEYGELTKGYRLNQIIDNSLHFLNSIHQDTSILLDLKSHIGTLLHPLSHFELESPIYKGELLRIENSLINLAPFLTSIKNNYKVVSPPLKKMRLNLIVSGTVTRRYAIVRIPQLYIININGGQIIFSECECYTPNVTTEETAMHITNQACDFKNNPNSFKFSSLNNAYSSLRTLDLMSPQYSTIPLLPNYVDAFEYLDELNHWQPLTDLLVW